MPAEDALLFIDANRYLTLYRTKTGRELLATLGEQANRIFVTQQIVNEVQRNKIKVAEVYLTTRLTGLKLELAKMPPDRQDIFGMSDGQEQVLLGEIKPAIAKA